MSFSQSVKDEILKNIKKMKGCCATAFLTAVMKSVGSLCVDFNGYCFSLETDKRELLTLVGQLAYNAFGVDCTIYQTSSPDQNKGFKYTAKFDVELGEKLCLTYRDEEGLHLTEKPVVNLTKDCCKRAFMQALFLCCGSATIPEEDGDAFAESTHSNYHLELRTSEELADFVLENYPELAFRRATRKNIALLYLKESEKIADFFVYVDAVNAKFTVENVIIGRSFRNTANRQRNCIDSNIDKAIAASGKHIAAINKIRQKGLFNNLPQSLKDMAAAREEYPEANLAELASILGISKSGVNHRLTKLLELAQD